MENSRQYDRSQERKIYRTHLFSGRLMSLSTLYKKPENKGKALPLFEKTTRRHTMELNFHGMEVKLIFSDDDLWTHHYVARLKQFQAPKKRNSEQQFQSFAGSLLGLLAGFTDLLPAMMGSALRGFTQTLVAASATTIQAIAILLKSNDQFTCVNALGIIIIQAGLSINILAKIFTPALTMGMVFQSGTKTPFSWLPTAVGCLLAVALGATNLAQFTGILTKTASLGYTVSTVNGVSRLLTETVKELLPFIYNILTGKQWNADMVMESLTSYQEFTTAVENFEAHKAADLNVNLNYQMEVGSLHEMYKKLLTDADRLKLRSELAPLISSYSRKIETWTRIVRQSGLLASGIRPEPVTILLSGKPGIGKSYLVNTLTKEIGQDSIPWKHTPGETIANHIYVRNPNDKFFSGYKGQHTIVYDDLLQLRDGESKENPEIMEIMNTVGCNAYHLNMASLEDKENGYFRSEMLIATSNLESFGASVLKSIVDPNAFKRRWSVHARVEREPAGEYRFRIFTDGEVGDSATMEQFVNICRAQYRAKQDAFKVRLSEAINNGTNIIHKCVAKHLGFISAPTWIKETEMKRRLYNAANPDHSFCHESLLCRQRQQSILDWFRSAPTDEVHTINMMAGAILLDPHLLDRVSIDQPTQDWLDHINNEVDQFALDDLREAIIGAGPEVYEPHELLTARHTFTFQEGTTAEQAGETATLYQETVSDLLAIGVHAPVEARNSWAHVLTSVLRRTFIGVTSCFAQMWNYMTSSVAIRCFILSSTIYAAVYAITAILIKLTDFIFEWVYGSPEPDLTDEEIIAIYDQMFESRDENGAQKSHKGKTARMGFEASGLDKLVIAEMDLGFGKKIKYVSINPDLYNGLATCNDVAERSELLEECGQAFKVYGAVIAAAVIATKKPVNSDTTRVMTMFVERLLAKGMSMEDICIMMEKKQYAQLIAATPDEKEKVMLYQAAIKNIKKPESFQGSADQNCDGVAEAIMKNLCDIGPQRGAARVSQVFFFKSRTAWMNKHAFESLKGNSKFKLTRFSTNGEPEELVFDWCDLKISRHDVLDIMLLQFPETLKPFQKVFQHIAKDCDLKVEFFPAGRIVTRRRGIANILNTPTPRFNNESFNLPTGEIVGICAAIRYDFMHTVSGDCGAPFLAVDPTQARKIFGLHMLGNSYGSGTSVVVTQEILEDLERNGSFESHVEVVFQAAPINPSSMVKEPLTTIETPFEPTKSKFRTSLCFGEVSKTTTRPTVLHHPDFDPKERGVKALQTPKHIINESFLKKCPAVLTRFIGGTVTTARTLTIEEACSGAGILGMEPIDRSTSAGLPLCNQPDAMGKKKWITEEHEPLPELRTMVDDFIEEIVQGEVTNPPIFKDTLKDERVKHEKADPSQPDKVKTRLFAACPLTFLVTLRMYFGAFFAHAMVNMINNTCTSGMNPFGADWERLSKWMFEVNKNVDDGDYRSYDTTQPSGFLKVVFDAIRLWYRINGGSARDDLIRKRLAEFCYHAFHSVAGTVYRVQGTLPSGMFGTTPINSGVNLIVFYYAFDQIYPEASANDFLDHVRTATHGDDVIFSVSERFPEFTSVNIGKTIADIGMTFTPAVKNGAPTVARPIEQVTFLKRGFKKINGLYRAPLATESSLEMVNWITKSNDPRSATIDNCKAAMRELALSEDTDELQTKIQAAVYNKTGVILPIISAVELCNEFYKFY